MFHYRWTRLFQANFGHQDEFTKVYLDLQRDYPGICVANLLGPLPSVFPARGNGVTDAVFHRICYIYKQNSHGRAVLVTEASTNDSNDSSSVDEADYQFEDQAMSFTVHRSERASRYLQQANTQQEQLAVAKDTDEPIYLFMNKIGREAEKDFGRSPSKRQQFFDAMNLTMAKLQAANSNKHASCENTLQLGTTAQEHQRVAKRLRPFFERP